MLIMQRWIDYDWIFKPTVDYEVRVCWNNADSKQTECVADGKSERLYA